MNEKLFKCQRCLKKFAFKPSLLVHMKHFHPEPKVARSDAKNRRSGRRRRFKCEHCSKIYKRKHFLARHIANIHQKMRNGRELEILKSNQLKANQQESKFKCESCSKCFSFEKILKKHIRVVHEKRYVCHCRICSKQFNDKRNLNRHIKDVQEKERFKCGSCHRCYSNEDLLNSHRAAAHNKETDFKCIQMNAQSIWNND